MEQALIQPAQWSAAEVSKWVRDNRLSASKISLSLGADRTLLSKMFAGRRVTRQFWDDLRHLMSLPPTQLTHLRSVHINRYAAPTVKEVNLVSTMQRIEGAPFVILRDKIARFVDEYNLSPGRVSAYLGMNGNYLSNLVKRNQSIESEQANALTALMQTTDADLLNRLARKYQPTVVPGIGVRVKTVPLSDKIVQMRSAAPTPAAASPTVGITNEVGTNSWRVKVREVVEREYVLRGITNMADALTAYSGGLPNVETLLSRQEVSCEFLG